MLTSFLIVELYIILFIYLFFIFIFVFVQGGPGLDGPRGTVGSPGETVSAIK